MKSETERWMEYEICLKRGHQSSGHVLASNPPWNICRHCGTHYRQETMLIESNAPKPVQP